MEDNALTKLTKLTKLIKLSSVEEMKRLRSWLSTQLPTASSLYHMLWFADANLDSAEIFYHIEEEKGVIISIQSKKVNAKLGTPIDSTEEFLVCLHSSVPMRTTLATEFASLIHERSHGVHKVCIKALNAAQYEPIAAGFAEFDIKQQWMEPCGFFRRSHAPISHTDSHTKPVPDAQKDKKYTYAEVDLWLASNSTETNNRNAQIINDNWKYKSDSSLAMIKLMLQNNPSAGIIATKNGGNVDSGELVGWILSYDDGAVGMLFILEEHRRKGLAQKVLKLLLDKTQKRRSLQLQKGEKNSIDYDYCYIVNGNEASESLFLGMGFERVASCSWKGFNDNSRK